MSMIKWKRIEWNDYIDTELLKKRTRIIANVVGSIYIGVFLTCLIISRDFSSAFDATNKVFGLLCPIALIVIVFCVIGKVIGKELRGWM